MGKGPRSGRQCAARGGCADSTGGYIDDQPTVWNGLIYFGSRDDILYAVTPGQASPWSLRTGGPIYSSPVVSNGTVYIGSDDGNLYAVNALTGPR